MLATSSDDHGRRILLATESFLPSVNGVSNSVVRMARYLRDNGHHPTIMAPGPGEDDFEGVPVVRVRSRDLPVYKGFPIGYPSKDMVDEVLDTVQPEVVHLAAPTVLGDRVARRAHRRDLPLVAIFQTDLAGFARSYGLTVLAPSLWWKLRRIHRLADVTLAPSQATARELLDHGIPRVGVWARGIDRELFDPHRRSPRFRRSVLGCDADRLPLVGYVGRLAKEKRIDLLADMARRTDRQLVIVGDGPHRATLERLMPRAHFTGMLRGVELAEAMASLDLFVHTGAHETFGQTIQEAMASGVPVVAPASGGPLDLVTPGRNGELYEPESQVALNRTVDELLADPDARAAMGATGRAMTEGRGWDALGRQLVDTYERCIALRSLSGLAKAELRATLP